MDHHAPPTHNPAPPEPPPAWEPPVRHLHPVHQEPPSRHHDPPGYHDGPEAPPPSYDDATNPLLGGVPPTYSYGTWQEQDDSSTASTEVESSDASLHEWVGNLVVISFFIAIIYGFWSMVNSPPDGLNHFPDSDPHARPRPD